MAQLATKARFEGEWYSSYGAFPFFADRAAWLDAEAPTGKLLIAGCGWGYLVLILNQMGRDAWGMDPAQYCMDNRVTPRMLQRSVLLRSDVAAVKSAAGLSGSARFAACLTEDLLPCLAGPNEVANALIELRRVSERLLHVVTPGDGTASPPGRVPEMGWRTVSEWKNVVGADLVMNAEGGAVL